MELKHLSLLIILFVGFQRSATQILHRQKRAWIIDLFTIDEGYNGSYPYFLNKIKVEKALSLFEIHGQGVDKEPRGILKINDATGEVFVHGPVDHEKFQKLKLTFLARDRENHVIDTQLGITIDILDANDNAPKFDIDKYEIPIKESTIQGTELVTLKATDLDSKENNKKISYRLVSFTPQQEDLEFLLTQQEDLGIVSFKGCLDYQKAAKYTLLVEARDHGTPSLSSTCTVMINIEDENNHLPVFVEQTGPVRVTEGEENILVSRLKVKDEDVKGSEAWRAKYNIQGDTNKNFRITTDPETNEGLLYLEKRLSYDEDPVKNITVVVENEVPYNSCKVVDRQSAPLWKIHTTSDTTSFGTKYGSSKLSSCNVSVIVEDVNQPPFFDMSSKHVSLVESVKVGTYLKTLNASDPDRNGANVLRYVKGNDPAEWIMVDSKTGKVTTAKTIDRESSFVKDGVYVVTVHAVDNGEPPLTGTATLSITVIDENDNSPSLVLNRIDICQSDEPSLANITAFDLDGQPYGGPFRFKLLGNVEDNWRVDPLQGYSVNLVKGVHVHAGIYQLLLEVSGLQGETVVHNLTVTVCSCFNPTKPSCTMRKPAGSTVTGRFMGIIILSILVLAGLLLLVLLLSCSRPKLLIPDYDCTQHLMPGNIEQQGTDCEVPLQRLDNYENEENIATKNKTVTMSRLFGVDDIKSTAAVSQFQRAIHQSQDGVRESQRIKNWLRGDSQRFPEWSDFQRRSIREVKFAQGSSTMQNCPGGDLQMFPEGSNFQRRSIRGTKFVNGCSAAMDLLDKGHYQREIMLRRVLHTTMTSLKDEELLDYAPHVYADEGDLNHNFELDAISIPEVSFDPDLDFDMRFSTLTSICTPADQH